MSFYYALEGIWAALRQEAHLRFHFAVGNLIIIFAYFFGITVTEWAVLLLDIAAVISAELFNTALENAVDTATSEHKLTAKLAKDAAAGAVLVIAITSIAVGICLFGNLTKIAETLSYIFTAPQILIPCLCVGTADVLFVIFGGKNAK